MMEKQNFENVYNNYYLKVYYYILKKLNNHQDAEDLTQEIFVVCLKNYEKYDPDRASLSTWIYTIVNNRLKNFYRDKKNNVFIDDEDNPIEIIGDTYIEEAIILEEQKRLLFDAIETLSVREQTIIKYKYFCNENSSFIANSLGITATNVRVILKRALEKISIYFKEKGYEIK